MGVGTNGLGLRKQVRRLARGVEGTLVHRQPDLSRLCAAMNADQLLGSEIADLDLIVDGQNMLRHRMLE